LLIGARMTRDLHARSSSQAQPSLLSAGGDLSATSRGGNLQYNRALQAGFRERNLVKRRLLSFFVALLLANLTAQVGHAQAKPQDKNSDPKVVLDLESATPNADSNANAKNSGSAPGSANAGAKDSDGASSNARTPFRIGGIPGAFGETCKAFSSADGPDRWLDKPVPISELFGAPIAVVKIRRYDAPLQNSDLPEVRARIAKILHAQTDEIARGILWSEATFAGLGSPPSNFRTTPKESWKNPAATSASPTMPAQFGTCAFRPTPQNNVRDASPNLAAPVHCNFRISTHHKNHSP